jgi:hypothetical protein
VGCLLAETSNSSFLRQGFIHSPVFRSKVFLGKGFTKRVWPYCFTSVETCVFLPVALLLGGKKVPSFFGIEIHYRSMN